MGNTSVDIFKIVFVITVTWGITPW